MSALRIGYVLKRFPRVSETFIAQEILGLERLGAEVHVISLVENDRPARHAWLGQIRAEVTQIRASGLAEVWTELSRRAREVSGTRAGTRDAVCRALEHPLGRGRRYLVEAFAVSRVVEELDLEHLHAHFANRPAFVASLASAISNRPFSFTAHAKDIYKDTNEPDYWRGLLARTSFAVTVSTANVRHIRSLAGPTFEKKIRLLYNGIDLTAVRPHDRPRQDGRLQVLCVARLVEKKGIDVLIEAMGILADRGIEVDCAILGDGPLGEELRARTLARGLNARVAFLGSAPHERVIEQMQRSDMVVLPCRVAADGDRDALPTVLLEAMASGIPCVSTPVGGVPEIVAHETTGLLVPSDSPAELARAMARLAADHGLRTALGRNARLRAERRFDCNRAAARLHRWFEEVGGGNRADATMSEPRESVTVGGAYT